MLNVPRIQSDVFATAEAYQNQRYHYYAGVLASTDERCIVTANRVENLIMLKELIASRVDVGILVGDARGDTDAVEGFRAGRYQHLLGCFAIVTGHDVRSATAVLPIDGRYTPADITQLFGRASRRNFNAANPFIQQYATARLPMFRDDGGTIVEPGKFVMTLAKIDGHLRHKLSCGGNAAIEVVAEVDVEAADNDDEEEKKVAVLRVEADHAALAQVQTHVTSFMQLVSGIQPGVALLMSEFATTTEKAKKLDETHPMWLGLVSGKYGVYRKMVAKLSPIIAAALVSVDAAMDEKKFLKRNRSNDEAKGAGKKKWKKHDPEVMLARATAYIDTGVYIKQLPPKERDDHRERNTDEWKRHEVARWLATTRQVKHRSSPSVQWCCSSAMASSRRAKTPQKPHMWSASSPSTQHR